MAYQIFAVAVGWHIYAITGSALDLGLIGLTQFAPSLALMLIVGHVADRYDRRRVSAACMVVGALAALALAGLAARNGASESAIFGAVLVVGTARAFQNPSMQALLPALVPKGELARAIASSATATQFATIAGPAIGGVLYVAGPAVAYLVCALLYVAGAALSTLIRFDHRPPSREPPSVESLLRGVAFIRAQPVMLGAISLDLFAVFLGGATALLPIYARDILDTGPWGLGILRSAPAAGALAMAIGLTRRPLGGDVGRKMFAAVAVYGGFTIVFGFSTDFWLSLASLAAMGAADMVSVVVRSSLVQLGTPDAMRGRVAAVNTLFIGASNQLGEFESGVTAAWFGTVPAVVLGGVGTLAVVALWMRLFPALARHDRLDVT